MAYNESSISYYSSDLEKIIARPSLYIGLLDIGVFSIFREAADNAVDEARAGRNSFVRIYYSNGEFTIVDGGAGIPVRPHPKAKISTLTHVITNLQSSGKIQGDAYSSSRGTHGVGLKATNALSSDFQVWTYRKDAGSAWYHTRFKEARQINKVAKASSVPVMPDGFKPKFGTIIRFTPNPKYLKHNINIMDVANWCNLAAYLNPNFQVYLWANGKHKTWQYKNGIVDYMNARIEELKANLLSTYLVETSTNNVDLVLCFADVEGCQVEFFTNTIRNVEMGVHADATFKALMAAIKPYQGKHTFTPSDLQEGLIGICNAKINAPQFDSQTKEKLVDNRIKEPLYNDVLAALQAYFKARPAVAKQIVQRASELRQRTIDFLKDKKLIKNVGAAKKNVLAKLAAVTGKTPLDQRELYIVEGDSAGGPAKAARYKNFQAVIPIRGKPLNVYKATKNKLSGNTELASILAATGIDMKKENPYSSIQYGKIIFLTDADVDGKHINCLLFGIFYRYLPELFKQHKIFIVNGPLFKGDYHDNVYFGHSKQDIIKQAKTDKVNITYLKGWGEVNAHDLQKIAFNVDNRELIKVLPPDKNGIVQFEKMLSNDTQAKRDLLGI